MDDGYPEFVRKRASATVVESTHPPRLDLRECDHRDANEIIQSYLKQGYELTDNPRDQVVLAYRNLRTIIKIPADRYERLLRTKADQIWLRQRDEDEVDAETVGADPALETVGEIDRADVAGR